MYKIEFLRTDKQQGWVIIFDGHPANDLFFISKEAAQKYMDRLEKLFNRSEKNEL